MVKAEKLVVEVLIWLSRGVSVSPNITAYRFSHKKTSSYVGADSAIYRPRGMSNICPSKLSLEDKGFQCVCDRCKLPAKLISFFSNSEFSVMPLNG